MAGLTDTLRWAIVVADLEPTVGHEQRGQRGVLVVSREPFHRSGMASICPIASRPAKYPGEVSIPRGEAGQTLDASILCHQVRTVDLSRVRALEIAGEVQRVTDRSIRRQVRLGLAYHFGLDLRAELDGAA